MPELPEVETIRRQLAPRLPGRRILAAHTHPSDKFTPARAATGTTIQGINRRGKYLIAPLDDGRELIIHLGMTGSLMVMAESSPERNEDPYIRAWWQLDHGESLIFRDIRRFGRIRCVPAGRYDTIPTLAAQGPDALSAEFTPEGFYQALRRSRRRIPTQLLSQKPVAGVGNIYATEALWMAGIHPGERRISRIQAAKLHTTLVQVLEAGLANGGTTLRDYRNADGGRGSHQHALACYGRSGQPCLSCATPLQHRTYDARTLTFCPQCQSR
ncbi:bifunctional DNA-formamidopyrimidine glycosylase/DNA-(apurinic or apyrimidinic site) lyase [Candidatus Poriferisocius sp.]|uniref:bifunctional DNA-formamidopyrimidine glycosylase/DNA-(apurinic or apyrimidinic site) lyase n=1 Tax=Candidatus Poriferisocius sp. TaxID=3101276 RepID=UPI003B0214C4